MVDFNSGFDTSRASENLTLKVRTINSIYIITFKTKFCTLIQGGRYELLEQVVIAGCITEYGFFKDWIMIGYGMEIFDDKHITKPILTSSVISIEIMLDGIKNNWIKEGF